MFQKIFFLLCISATYSLDAKDERVIGGWEAVVGQFGHQVSIRDNYKHICGGTILDKWTILTAAHCLEGRMLTDLLVIAGTNYLTIGGQAYDVFIKIVHHDYNQTTGDHDLAILKLTVPIQFTERIRVATLPVDPPTSDLRAYITGWGWRTFPGNFSEELRYFNVPTMPLEDCAVLLEKEHAVTAKHICINPSAGVGICVGDLGNGMFDYSDYFVGMAIWSSNPCGAGNPDLYTNIYLYKDWIIQNMTPE